MNLWSGEEAWQLDGENRFRHKDAFYFLPSEDEWYKAAYHKNDGVTANYWDYATGSNVVPTRNTSATTTPGTAIYNTAGPVVVNMAGGLSPYGTMGQNGNVSEYTESGAMPPNDSVAELRVLRGGDYTTLESQLRSSARTSTIGATAYWGFRVASIPEPSSTLLLTASGGTLLLRRRR
jgi:formylglycine-generating enzyme required for sulfatase activity